MASWLDARAHGGTWLVRIEDIDPPRDVPGAGEAIIKALARFGMTSDEPILWQHDRLEAYADALAKLTAEGFIYGCACSRKEIQLADDWRVSGHLPTQHSGAPSACTSIPRARRQCPIP